jgi:hypothetical protein
LKVFKMNTTMNTQNPKPGKLQNKRETRENLNNQLKKRVLESLEFSRLYSCIRLSSAVGYITCGECCTLPVGC